MLQLLFILHLDLLSQPNFIDVLQLLVLLLKVFDSLILILFHLHELVGHLFFFVLNLLPFLLLGLQCVPESYELLVYDDLVACRQISLPIGLLIHYIFIVHANLHITTCT